MNNVIFSSSISVIALISAAVIYLLIGISRKYLTANKIIPCILGIINMILHIGIFMFYLYLKASMQEILFVFVASSAVALTVTRKRRGE